MTRFWLSIIPATLSRNGAVPTLNISVYFLKKIDQVLKVEVVAIISDELLRKFALQEIRHFVGENEA
jgi:hypothetical protein